MITKITSTIFLGFFMSLHISAQWSPDSTINTLVSNASADDIQSVTTSDGKTCAVFWHSVAAPTNYELRLQVLDTAGIQQLGNNGALISSSIPMGTFTQQWSLSIDNNDNLYVGLTGTNGNGGYVYKVDTSGANLWGASGHSLGTGYVVRTLPLSTGDVIVSWLDNSYNGNIQKFDASGTAIWTNPVGLSAHVPAESFELSDEGNITIYHQLSTGINSIMYAQRYNAAGVPQWNNTVQLFASTYRTAYNSQYSGMQHGDTIYYSYKLAHNSRFDAYVQRINPDGSLPWGVTGSDFSTNQTDFEQEIKIAGDSSTPYLWAVCRYTDASQGQQGVYLQQFDKGSGQRMLGNTANPLYPLSTTGATPAGKIQLHQTNPIFLINQGSELRVTLIDSSGNFAWTNQSKAMASTANPKSRVDFNSLSPFAFVATFVENRGGGDTPFAHKFAIEQEDEDTSTNGVSINELCDYASLKYNNPVQEELSIQSTSAMQTIVISNVAGQIVSKLDDINTTQVFINTSRWNPGFYFVSIISDNRLSKKGFKVLKQ